MNPISRGIRNAFRNMVRTGSIVAILGLSIGLSLTMLIAQKAVDTKIKNVKASIGNTITVAPAGFQQGASANNALTTSELAKVSSLAHVSNVVETLTDRQSTTGASSFGGGRFGQDDTTVQTTTSLTSPVTLDNNGPRFFGGGAAGSDGASTMTFSLPVSFLGTTDSAHIDSTALTLKSGKTISGDTNNALISSAMASKNSLSIGSTFTAYNATLTVAGIFTTSSSNQNVDNTVVLSLPALQRLTGNTGVVSSAVVTVDSLDNLSSVTSKISNTLGSGADVTSAQEQADATIKPLNSVKTVSTFSLIGAVVAGAVIILLLMVMIVRERKREIGIVKAIGGSNPRIMVEFMVESLTLAILGAVVGLLVGVIGGQPVTNALVSSNTTSTTQTAAKPGEGGFSRPGGTVPNRAGFGGRIGQNSTVKGISNIKTQIGLSILVEGFGAAIVIALLGSALSAGLIARVRPNEVLRSA